MTSATETTKTCTACGATHSEQTRRCAPCQAEFFRSASVSPRAAYVVRANGSFAYGAQAEKILRLAR